MTDQNDNPYAPPRDPANAEVAEWGTSSLPREYRPRKIVRWMQYGFPVLGGTFALAMVGFFAWTEYHYGFRITAMTLGLYGMWLVLPVEVVLISVSFYRAAGT